MRGEQRLPRHGRVVLEATRLSRPDRRTVRRARQGQGSVRLDGPAQHRGPVVTARVRWQPGASGSNLLGYVGTLPSWAFQIFQSGDPDEGRKMIAQLPGMSGLVARDP